MFWFQRTTAIHAGDNLIHFIVEKVSPISLIIFTIATYLATGSVWPIVILLIGSVTIGRLSRWFNSYLLSQMWHCNVSLFFDRERKTHCRWIWRDRTCIDIYTFCLINKATAVPLNMPEILLEQTRSTSVAIILDLPQSIIEHNLRERMHAPSSNFVTVFYTRLMVTFGLFIQDTIAALTLIERWYAEMNVPVIKISQINEKLDHDKTTGNIQWTQHSIDVLLQTIERAIEERRSPSTIKDFLIPWKITRKPHLCLQ
jgi:hypothetical protein